MKPSTAFVVRIIIIAGLSAGLGLTFNASRQDSLPLIHVRDNSTQLSPQSGEISLQDASRLFSSGQAVFLDARPAEDFAEGHIEGALSLPIFSFTQDFDALKSQMEGRTVITYCDGEACELSRDLADQLKAHGLKDVLVLKNGWTLWKDSGLPTATGQVIIPQDLVPQEPASQETAPQAPELQPAPLEPMPQEPAPQEPVPQEPLLQPAPTEPASQEPELQEAAPQDPMLKESAPQEPASQEPAQQETAPTEPMPQEPKPAGDQS
jgi:rhodanese-related sulfurtransferase